MTSLKIPTAGEIMNRRVHTIEAGENITAGIHALLRAGHSGAPVVDADGRVVGVLSEHDCVRVLAEAVAERWPSGRVEDHMTREIETVAPEEDVLALATRFSRGRHRRLLVLEDGRLVGLVTRRDLMRALDAMEGRARKPTTYEVIEKRKRDLG